MTYNVSTVDLNNIEQSHRYSVESVGESQRRDIWTGFNNHSLAYQKSLYFPSFTDLLVRVHLKKCPYITRIVAVITIWKQTNEEPLKFTELID